MPKTNRDFPDRLDVSVPVKLHQEMVAIAYYMGLGRIYAPIARNYCEAGVREFLGKLGEKERARFDEILQNVQIGWSK